VSISTLVRPAEPIIEEVRATEDPVQALVNEFMMANDLNWYEAAPIAAMPEPVTDQVLAHLARKAADEVEMRGWTRHKMVNCAGQVCAMGALATAANPNLMEKWFTGDEAANHASRVVDQCAVRFAMWLGARYGVPNWNDGHQSKASRVPSPQSAADVAAAFRGFADALLAGKA